MLEITPTIRLDENEIHIDFVQSSGPGGQNVNKVATAAQLRFDLAGSPSLPEAVRQRAICLAGKRLTQEGILVLDARQYRSQDANREAAVNRLVAMLRQAAAQPKVRRPTIPSAAAKARRIEEKRRRGSAKMMRRFQPDSDNE